MGRAHSCAVPSSMQLFSLPPMGAPQRRAASTPESLPDFLTGMPADLGRPGDADGMTGQHPKIASVCGQTVPCVMMDRAENRGAETASLMRQGSSHKHVGQRVQA